MSYISAFLNLDIAILASPHETYAAYAAANHQEFNHVPVDAYRVGRAKILSGFIERGCLFFGGGVKEQEALARRNLGDEIEGLESGRLPGHGGELRYQPPCQPFRKVSINCVVGFFAHVG